MAAEYLALMGERIRQRRDEMELSRADLARRLPGKTNENQVYRWEKGLHQPNPDTLDALARVLGCDVAYFMAPAAQKAATPSPFTDTASDVASRLTAIEDAIERIAARLEVGIGNQEEMLRLIGARQNSNLEKVQESFDQIRSLLATATDPPPAPPSRGQDRSRRRAA